MNKYKNLIINLFIICSVVLFVILSYFKLYTVQVKFNNDPTVAIVKTKNIQWRGNTYRINNESLPYNCYDDYGFEILHADESGNMWQQIYSLSITIWWFILIYLLFNLSKLINTKLKTSHIDRVR